MSACLWQTCCSALADVQYPSACCWSRSQQLDAAQSQHAVCSRPQCTSSMLDSLTEQHRQLTCIEPQVPVAEELQRQVGHVVPRCRHPGVMKRLDVCATPSAGQSAHARCCWKCPALLSDGSIRIHDGKGYSSSLTAIECLTSSVLSPIPWALLARSEPHKLAAAAQQQAEAITEAMIAAACCCSTSAITQEHARTVGLPSQPQRPAFVLGEALQEALYEEVGILGCASISCAHTMHSGAGAGTELG